MRGLILLRHARTEAEAMSGQDIDRALTAEGRTEAQAAGRALAAAGCRPDLVLISPAVRARETWAAAAPAFSGVPTRVEPGLYEAEPSTLLDLAHAAGEGGVVMLVAHNPGLSQLAERLGAPDPGLPTGHAAVFAIEDGTFRFRERVSPA